MRVLVTGAAGMLGRQVTAEYVRRGAEVYPLTRKELNITNNAAVKSAIVTIRPHLVVNCAAFTNVDRAEVEREAAFTVNGLGPRLLTAACRPSGATLVHISTDYIFNGRSPRPYLVCDPPDPINIYGMSKLMGEQSVRESGCGFYIVRASWLFGPGGKNFVDTILKLASEKDTIRVVDDQLGCPTYAPNLARAIADLTATGLHGTYHITNTGAVTRFEFAKKIIETAGLKTKVEPCSSTEFPGLAPRPANSSLDPFPLALVVGCTPPRWEKAAHQYISTFDQTQVHASG